jgi:hypothetical protein
MKSFDLGSNFKLVFPLLTLFCLAFVSIDANAQATYEQCKEAEQTAMKACTTQDMQAGMNPQQQMAGQQLMQQANQANQQVGQNGANQGAQCQNQADLSKILSGLSALKGGACVTTIENCSSTCEEFAKQAEASQDAKKRSEASQARKKIKVCESMNQNAGQAFAQAASLMAGMMANLQCAQNSATQQTPGSPTPVQDCSNPEYAKTNIICICQNDPKNAMCTKGESFQGGVQSSSGSLGASLPGFNMDDDLDSDGMPVSLEAPKPDTARGSNAPGQGGGGGMPAGGSGGAPAFQGGGDDGYGRSNVDKNVITGQAAGGGGGGGGAGAFGGGGGGGGGGGRGSAPRDMGGAFDLSKYLPKGKTRGLAGMSVTAKDGITGPMGPTIWEKVSTQYQNQKGRLIQDR